MGPKWVIVGVSARTVHTCPIFGPIRPGRVIVEMGH
jgi:hypothetical protein